MPTIYDGAPPFMQEAEDALRACSGNQTEAIRYMAERDCRR
jgi:hypothetical protein